LETGVGDGVGAIDGVGMRVPVGIGVRVEVEVERGETVGAIDGIICVGVDRIGVAVAPGIGVAGIDAHADSRDSHRIAEMSFFMVPL
jgi:hypothetical protein